MKLTIRTVTGLVIGTLMLLAGCKQSLVISQVDYSRPLETVISPTEGGMIIDKKHGLKFSMMPLQYAETEDTSSVTTKEIRYIRGESGLYYLTAPTYTHVYLMMPAKNEMKVEKRIMISETGIEKPAFNQRDSFIQLVNRTTGETYKLTPEGMTKEETTKSNMEDQ